MKKFIPFAVGALAGALIVAFKENIVCGGLKFCTFVKEKTEKVFKKKTVVDEVVEAAEETV